MALDRAQLARRIRAHVGRELYDESGVRSPEVERVPVAIYTLSDPRDIRCVRYVGQTSDPRRRFLQHLNTARLWLPDEQPWWVATPTLRPLYTWLRALYRDELRLPTMVVGSWTAAGAAARVAERTRIHECLRDGLTLLNVEAEIRGKQLPLL